MGCLKNWVFGKESPTQIKRTSPQKEDPHAKYLSETLAFAKAQHHSLTQKQRDYVAWQHRYGSVHVDELKKLNGIEFEDYLYNLFEHHSYKVETTPTSGDYGADLILVKDKLRIAVQAKCYTGSVGISAVQEALSGKAYYHCDSAWVVTTGSYTTNAIKLANKSSVRLLGRRELGTLIVQMQSNPKNHA